MLASNITCLDIYIATLYSDLNYSSSFKNVLSRGSIKVPIDYCTQ